MDTLPVEVLDLLAIQFHVDFYDLAATEEMKRESVKSAIKWHMKKGTSWAIIQALKSIGIDGEFLHWHDTGDEPYTFRIRANITGDFYRTIGRDKIIKSIYRVVNESKAARSYFAGLETNINFHEDINLHVANIPLLSGQEIIKLRPDDGISDGKFYAGLAGATQGSRRIFPARDHALDCKIYSGLVTLENISFEIGVDLDTMQELLTRFEDRIFTRIDSLESNMNAQISEQNTRIENQFENLYDLLRWKEEI